ncbi:MAG: 3-deoxy-D-manno-octulosonic acid transferase [Planctomycetes bacterium]|nr:3-deoxy-D-manno-octulosonic acid transferase [Planctomycetota bacterium]
MISWLLNCVYFILLLLLTPFILFRMICQNRYRTGWKERFGFVPRRYSDQPCIWIHAVSLGEINAIGTLIKHLHKVLPQYEIVISSTTDTGITRAKKLYGLSHKVFFYPLDFSFAVRRALNRLHPQLCILMELEVWPNFTTLAQKRDIPIAVANGRISSQKGYPRYRKIAPLVRPLFRRLSLVLAQDQTYAERFQSLGVPEDRLQVVGLLKYDTANLTDNVPGADELAQSLKLTTDHPIWIAGSTGPNEEKIILDTFDQLIQNKSLQNLRLIVVPRKPERFNEVANLIESRNHRLLRYSQIKSGKYQPTPADQNAVILGDTLGDLRKFYSLARIIFVGRSLVPMGGSDMIEAAALAKTVVVGPYTDNFIDTVQKLTAANAIEIVLDGTQLTKITQNLLLNPQTAQKMAQNAQQIIQQNQGATQRTVEHIIKLLDHQPPLGPKSIATPAIKNNS